MGLEEQKVVFALRPKFMEIAVYRRVRSSRSLYKMRLATTKTVSYDPLMQKDWQVILQSTPQLSTVTI
jgi:hypothetical protein